MSALSGINSSIVNSVLSSLEGSGSSSSPTGSSSLPGLSTSGVSFTGLASGLNTNELVQGLTAAQQAVITGLQNQETQLSNQQSAYQTLQSDLQALQASLANLYPTFNSVFDARTVSSSNQNLATGAATGDAAPGTYTFTVQSLAQAEQIASQGFASASSAITQGTFQFAVGNGPTTTVTINGTNDTLQGLAGAINNANGGLTASIVDDGSNGSPYHLLLTANNTGAANTINITNNLAAGTNQPAVTDIVQQAQDASVSIGNQGFTVSSPTNTVDGLFNGISVSLTGADPNQPVTLTVANDVSSAVTAVSNFVTAFNAVVDYINQNNTYNTSTTQAGIFLGSPDASNIDGQLTQSVLQVVSGLSSQANNLAAIGITLNSSGDLAVNTNQLTEALSGQLSGITPDDVRQLFVQNGQSTNSGIQFVAAGSQTKAYGQPIQVQVTQAAGSGQNVAGYFIVNGVEEPATGSGNILTGNPSNANTPGLEVQVSLTPSQITAQPEGSVTVTQGVAASLNQLLGQLLDPVSGQLTNLNQSFQSQENTLQQSITAQQATLTAQQQSLMQQFVTMETTLAQLQSVGSFLTAQFATNTSTTGG